MQRHGCFTNKLQMNDDKTEAILFAPKGLATEHLPKSIKIDDTAINFVPMLRDLGVTLDSLHFHSISM